MSGSIQPEHDNGFPDGFECSSPWQGKSRFNFLATGVGAGAHFLRVWNTFQNKAVDALRLNYLVIAPAPMAAEAFIRHPAHAGFHDHLRAKLLTAWPTLTPGFHRLEFEAGKIILTLIFGDPGKAVAQPLLQAMAQIQANIDWFYLDTESSLEPAHIKRLARMANQDATLEVVRPETQTIEALEREGFVSLRNRTEANSGRPHLARFIPKPWHGVRVPALQQTRHAVIIGAGLAGTACAERLAVRGWSITLIDQHNGPAQAASGNLAGIAMPLVARDDNIAARLSRAAFLHAVRNWKHLSRICSAQFWAQTGVVQLARDGDHEAVQKALVSELGYPTELVDYLDRPHAEALIGQDLHLPAGGWHFKLGGWVNPPGLCAAMLAQAEQHAERTGSPLTWLFGKRVRRIESGPDGWRVMGKDNAPLAVAEHVILASGAESAHLAQTQNLPLDRTRGQVTLLPEGMLAPLNVALCREGYVTPAVKGMHCLGASYDLDDEATLRPQDHAGNLERLERLLPGIQARIEPDACLATLDGRVGFRAVGPDRLPLVGLIPDYDLARTSSATQLDALPRHTGLYAALGYASRGLVWSTLMAELLASQIEGDPLPIETALARAVDPGRFILKQIRRQIR